MQGFPWVLIGSVMTLWLQEEGFSRGGIGLFGIIGAIYAFNPLWAPLVDTLRIPLLADKFGQRRSWILLMQIIIAALMVGMSMLNPSANLLMMSILCAAIAAAGATQDVAIDALRIELIAQSESQKLGASSAMATSGWWAGFGVGGALAFYLAEQLENNGIANYWQLTYLCLIAFVAVCASLTLIFVDEPSGDSRMQAQKSHADNLSRRIFGKGRGGIIAAAVSAYAMPVAVFLRRYSWKIGLILLALIFLFKIGEAFLGRMSLVFYKEIGFSKGDIATYSKLTGAFAVCFFAVISSVLNARFGLFRGLVIGGIAMASTNLLFAILAFTGPEKWLFAVAVVADQFTTAVSTVAFVAFISQLCDRTYTASQYAAFASLGNLSRTTLAGASGFMVDGLGGNWAIFFVLTALMILPSLILLFSVRRTIAPLMEGATVKML